MAFTADAPAPELAVKIDDRDTVLTAATDRLEAFRELAMGEHRITVSGNTRRRAPARAFHPRDLRLSPVRQLRRQGKRQLRLGLHEDSTSSTAVTTLNGGALPGDALAEAKARGLKWLANFNVAPVDDPADVRDRMEKHAGMTQPQYDGFTSDELFFGRATIDNYTKALWGLRNPENRLIYTWIVGKPSIAALHTDFMSAA